MAFIDAALGAEIVSQLQTGAKIRDIASRIGVTRRVLQTWISRYESNHGRITRRGRGNLEQAEGDDASGARCKCFLRLPCNNCLDILQFTHKDPETILPPHVAAYDDFKAQVKRGYDKFMSTRQRRQFAMPVKRQKGQIGQ